MSILTKWYWRMADAVGCGFLIFAFMLILVMIRWTISGLLWSVDDFLGSTGYTISFILLLCSIPAMFVVILKYRSLTKKYATPVFDSEIRCRNCGYILRGITEPRCPECWEKI